MRLFKRKTPTLTVEVYSLWLRAHRPPMDWFLGQDPMQQAAMADVGDAHLLHCIDVAQGGHGIADPEPDRTAMEQAALDLARRIAEKNGNQTGPGLTTAGFRNRRGQADKRAAEDRSKGASFLGREPDQP